MREEASRPAAADAATILIVEDDASIRWSLKRSLEREGFLVAVAADGEEGLAKAIDGRPDLCLVDVMLPKLNGFEMLKSMKKRGSAVPVVFLTAKGSEMDRVLGLDLGADDYIAKPFSLRELLARVHAVLRRAKPRGKGPSKASFGEFVLDLDGRRLLKGGRPVEVTQREFELLKFFVSHPGRVLTRREILNRVWGYDYYGTDRTVDNFVNQLREKIGDDAERPRRIVTVRGAGYRFDGPVAAG